MKYRSIPEWGFLKHKDGASDDSGSITSGEAKRLYEISSKYQLSKQVSGGALNYNPNSIQARGVVGILQTESCALEILPKIDVRGENEGERNEEIRKRLIHMISVAHSLNINIGAKSSLSKQNQTLLEILIEQFARKLADAVKQGLPQKYIRHEDDLPTLRGSLNIPRQFTVHAANPSRLACRFDQFSTDIALNQVMKSAVTLLLKITKSMKNQLLLRELDLVFADITYVPANKIRWDLIAIDRTNERWRELFTLARLFLNREFQTTTTGAITGYSMLFEMNKLFEEFIGRLIQKAAVKLRKTDAYSNIVVKLQSGRKYCIRDTDTNVAKFQTRPDILVKSEGSIVRVIDTKWKQIPKNSSDVWNDVSQGDVYQMMAYGEVYEPTRLTLFYPHNRKLGEIEGRQTIGSVANHDERHLEIFSFDVGDGTRELERLTELLVN